MCLALPVRPSCTVREPHVTNFGNFVINGTQAEPGLGCTMILLDVLSLLKVTNYKYGTMV